MTDLIPTTAAAAATDFDPIAHGEMVRSRLEADAQHAAEYHREAAARSAETDRALEEHRKRLLALPPPTTTSKVQAELRAHQLKREALGLTNITKLTGAEWHLRTIEALLKAIPDNVSAAVPNRLITDAETALEELKKIHRTREPRHPLSPVRLWGGEDKPRKSG